MDPLWFVEVCNIVPYEVLGKDMLMDLIEHQPQVEILETVLTTEDGNKDQLLLVAEGVEYRIEVQIWRLAYYFFL
jgi:hypothetical protein